MAGVALILMHPEVANRSCEDCARWLYDEKTGKRLERNNQGLARPAGTPTPCWNCPKKSPQEAKTIELSRKNMTAYDYYSMARAPLGDRLPADAITLRNHAIIDLAVRQAESITAMRATYYGVGAAFSGSAGGKR